ncbi:MAG: LamG domain-containing protein, partial [Candidatus Pacebacteria bacterium]|nr:LamG domain-containing protein [Candidatus Paceibacterota bacterium]
MKFKIKNLKLIYTEYRIQNTEYRPRGQSLLEALLSIALGVILIGGSVGLIGVSLRTFNIAKQHLQANSLVRQTAEILISLTRDNWHNIYDLTPGIHYKLAKQNNSYVIQKGEEKIFDSQGLVSYWSFDEATSTIAYDNQSTNNGTLYNSPPWQSPANCVSGSCLSFDGSNQYVNCGNDSSLNITDAITVEAWVKPFDVVQETENFVTHYINRYSESAFEFFSYGATLAVYLNNYSTSITSSCLIANQWQHIVFTYDKSLANNNLKLFRNGQQKNQVNYSQPLLTSSGSLELGKSFEGTIDEVRIYNRALSAEEIKTHYQAGLDKLGLVAYWAMDENGETTAYDNQSTNNGTLVNSPTWKSGSDCISGNCLSFDGSNQYVNCGNDSSLNITDAITVEAWVKPFDVVQETENFVTHYINRYSESAFEFFSYGATLAVYLNNYSTSITSSCLIANQWQHIVFTYDKSLANNNLKLFRNGQQKNQVNYSQPLLTSSGSLELGKSFEGTIDEVRIYNRALSAEEISQRYQASYTKYFTPNKVSRTSGSIDTTYNSANDDPSTLKINSVIKYGRGLITQQTGGINNLTFYLTRSYNNQTFHQTDWSGGSGQTGPIPNPGNKFDTADSNINYASTTGSIYMTTAT